MKPLNEDSDKKKVIIEKYNSTSKFYDDRYSKIQNEKYTLQFKNIDFKNTTLLDAGCGTGLLYEYIFSVYGNDIDRKFRFIGIDISWKMLMHFSDKIRKLDNNIKPHLVLGDIENLPFRDSKFNLIFSITSLQNLHNLKKGLRELIRVGRENTALKLTILRKQLQLEEVITYLNLYTVNLKTDIFEEVEDVIIQGDLKKD